MHLAFCRVVQFLHIVFGILGEAFAECSEHCDYPSLINATSDELQSGLQHGCFTSVDLVNAYTQRINEANSTLHMVLELNPDAEHIARELDFERWRGHSRGPLHGLPVMIKQPIGTRDKMSSAAGGYAIIDAKVPVDSTVVVKMREQGLIILGTTSLSEWYNIRSFNSSNGWNAQGGQTYGAYHVDQDPNGSSSGSAVSTDLGLALATLGTETKGSILLPAGVNNVVGIKPTVGLTSRYMVIPASPRQDTIGPLARTVKDGAKMLQAIAGVDEKDNYTLASPFTNGLPDYVAACDLSALKGKRIGIPRNVIDLTAREYEGPVLAAFEEAISVMSDAGADIVENTNFTGYDEYISTHVAKEVLAIDFKSSLKGYFSNLQTNPNDINDLGDLRNFTWYSPLEEYLSRGTKTWDIAIMLGLNNTSPEFWSLYQTNLYYGGEGGVLGAISRNNLDAVILPTSMAPDIPAVVGSPGITVPLGAMPEGSPVVYNNRGNLIKSGPGIPFGISFLGDKWSEETLIGIAYAFEQKTLHRQKLERYIEPEADLKGVV